MHPLAPGLKVPVRGCNRCSPGTTDRPNPAYVEHDGHTCPCHAAGHPCHGVLAATTDPDRIAAWWARTPAAGVGVAAGPSVLVILDMDCHGGDAPPDPERLLPGVDLPDDIAPGSVVDGRDVLALLVEARRATLPGCAPETLTVHTPSGGLHYWFRAPAGTVWRPQAGALGWQLDVRAGSSYAVAPGTVTRDGAYTALGDCRTVAELPVWLARDLDRTGHRVRPERPRNVLSWRPRRVGNGYVASAVEAELRAVAEALPGTRNTVLNRAAFSLGTLVRHRSPRPRPGRRRPDRRGPPRRSVRARGRSRDPFRASRGRAAPAHPCRGRRVTPAPIFNPRAAARSVVPFPRPEAGAEPPRAPKPERQPPQAELLRVLGQNRFRYLHHNGAPYAVPYDGPPVAVPLRATAHSGTGSLRQHLIRAYVAEHDRTPSQSALADALGALDALTMDAPETELHLRVAPDPDDAAVSWLDLGRPDGESVRLAPGEWVLTHPDPETGPIWRRSKLIRPLPRPDPTAGGWCAGIEEFATLLPFTEQTLPLAVGWLLAALRPDIPRPVAYLTGEQGTGKSTSGQMLAGIIEEPRAPLRQAPENLRDLGPTTAAGWVLALDNLSGLPGWLSDSLCRIVTGDAQVTRALYTDDDVNVLTYQRPVLLTGIDLGALRNDLAERMMPLELQPIPRHKRRTAGALWAAYAHAHPRILGALLDLAAAVWADLPYAAAELAERPRLADFAELLHALDRVTGWRSLDAFTGVQDALNDAVLDGHPVAAALREWTVSPAFPATGWQGTMAELHRQLGNDGRGLADGWPKTPAVLSARIRQVAPALRARGIHVARASGSNKHGKMWTVTYAPPT